jgi:hypothetical protein
MASNDSQQMSEMVPQHKRMAMGVKLNGSTMKSGTAEPAKPAPKSGGLAQAKKK